MAKQLLGKEVAAALNEKTQGGCGKAEGKGGSIPHWGLSV